MGLSFGKSDQQYIDLLFRQYVKALSCVGAGDVDTKIGDALKNGTGESVFPFVSTYSVDQAN